MHTVLLALAVEFTWTGGDFHKDFIYFIIHKISTGEVLIFSNHYSTAMLQSQDILSLVEHHGTFGITKT